MIGCSCGWSPQGRGWYRNGNILPDGMFAGFTNSANDKTKDDAFGFEALVYEVGDNMTFDFTVLKSKKRLPKN